MSDVAAIHDLVQKRNELKTQIIVGGMRGGRSSFALYFSGGHALVEFRIS
jgi:hypothetical protein